MCPGGWMKLHRLLGFSGLLLWLAANWYPAIAGAATTPSHGPVLEVFVSDSCPHCAKARAYLSRYGAEHPEVTVLYRSLERDAGAPEALVNHSRRAGIWPPGVPTFVVGERVAVGYDNPKQAEQMLSSLLYPQKAEGLSGLDRAVKGLPDYLSVDRVGLPLFTLAFGLLDGFNPCAMWVLLFLLSLLVHLRDRGRMAWIAGTFVLASGLVYYAFMATWLNLFLAIGLSETVRLGLGAVAMVVGVVNVKDFALPGQGISLSIPAAAKPGLYARMRRLMHARSLPVALVGVCVLALIVNLFEALCTAGLPAVYTAVLSQQGLPPIQHYAYLGLYIVGYIADDALMVSLAVLALSSRKLGVDAGRSLKLLSGAIMLVLGLILLFKPAWLL